MFIGALICGFDSIAGIFASPPIWKEEILLLVCLHTWAFKQYIGSRLMEDD